MGPSLLKTYLSAACNVTLTHDKCVPGCTTLASNKINQWFVTRGASRYFQGARTLTCSTTWKVFGRECFPSKRYASAHFTPLMLFGLVPTEMEVGVKYLEISQA